MATGYGKTQQFRFNQSAVGTWVDQHLNTLGLCRDYANTRKHMRRSKASARAAQITSIEVRPVGYAATIGYWRVSQPAQVTEIDALDLAERSERDWRALLATKSIPIPPP